MTITPRPLTAEQRIEVLERCIEELRLLVVRTDHTPEDMLRSIAEHAVLKAVEQERDALKASYRIWFGYDNQGGFGNALSEATYQIAVLKADAEAYKKGWILAGRQVRNLEIERDVLRARIAEYEQAFRETHEQWCVPDYTDRHMHSHNCLLYMIEESVE